MRELNRQFSKVLRAFEPSRYAEYMLTTGYQKLVPILSRRTSAASARGTPGAQFSLQSPPQRAKSGGAP